MILTSRTSRKQKKTFQPGPWFASVCLLLLLTLFVGVGCKRTDESAANTQLAKAKKLIESGNYAEAFLTLNQALAMAPRDPQVHLNLGWLYLYTDDLAQAQRELKNLEELAPDLAETYHLRGALYSHQAQEASNSDLSRKSQEKAVENFRTALQRDAKNDQTYLDLATSLIALGQHAEALEVLNQGFDHIPPNDLESQVNFQIASCSAHVEMHLYEEAIADCSQALEFTRSPATRERIKDMIENMKLMNPKLKADNEVLDVSPEGAMQARDEAGNHAGTD